jgi:hypothetical protein
VNHLVIASSIDFAPYIWAGVGILGAVGLLALSSPSRFHKLCTRSDHWVDTDKLLEPLNRRIDLDQYILPFSRILGGAVLASAVLIGYLYATY